jgi:hypothetical protein
MQRPRKKAVRTFHDIDTGPAKCNIVDLRNSTAEREEKLCESIPLQSIITLLFLLCIFVFCIGFICSNVLIFRRASSRQGYRTNRGKLIRFVDD